MFINQRIKFFTFYGCIEKGKSRDSSPAADTKIDYIINVLNRHGYTVDLISKAPSAEPHFVSGSFNSKGVNTYRYFASFGKTKSPLRIINRLLLDLQFLFWCIMNLTKNEQIIVYHSLGYDATFLILHKIKSIRIIGEIEEIYQDVCKQTKKRCRNEYKFISACNKYIFPTQLLDQKVNIKHKPSITVHGIYSSENLSTEKFSDGKFHIVYGGTLDPNKGGAEAAALSALFLPKNYHVHICGFGNATKITELIKDIQNRTDATITFEGELKGNNYKSFIQKCHIGLSTQNPKASFNDTSFPSKILVYLSNGLNVVSIRIPVVSQSSVADQLFFYDEQKPEKIAEAIIFASNKENHSNEILASLDRKFSSELNNLILA